MMAYAGTAWSSKDQHACLLIKIVAETPASNSDDHQLVVTDLASGLRSKMSLTELQAKFVREF